MAAQTLDTAADGRWSVVANDGRLTFSNGGSQVYVPVDGPLRWVRDGAEISFDEALEAVPDDLHGWMALAAVISLRQCLGGLLLAVALPAGEQEWGGLADRAGPLVEWMGGLAELEGVQLPAAPGGLDDGFGDAVGGSLSR
jgi:hypothetical protein